MKCYVCGREYEGNECPRCRFPDVQVPGASWEEARKALSASIDAYRTNYLQSIRAELVTYYWKDENGVCVLDHEDLMPLGSGTELYQKELWLGQKFARIEKLDAVPVRLRITAGAASQEKEVALPNLHAAELQQIGIELNDRFQFLLKLRNDSETPTCASPVDL